MRTSLPTTRCAKRARVAVREYRELTSCASPDTKDEAAARARMSNLIDALRSNGRQCQRAVTLVAAGVDGVSRRRVSSRPSPGSAGCALRIDKLRGAGALVHGVSVEGAQ